MNVGELYFVTPKFVVAFDTIANNDSFGPENVFRIPEGSAVIILEKLRIHENISDNIFLFKCLTPKGVGFRKTSEHAFGTWFTENCEEK